MLSTELNLRLSQVKDSLMNILQLQIRCAINSVYSDRVIPETQNIMGSMSFGQSDTESCLSINKQEKKREEINRLKNKIYKEGL